MNASLAPATPAALPDLDAAQAQVESPGALLEQEFEALPRRQSALRMDLGDAFRSAARERFLAPPAKLGQSLITVHGTHLQCVWNARRSLGTARNPVKHAPASAEGRTDA